MGQEFVFTHELQAELLKWGVPLLGAVVAAGLVTPIVDRIKFLWNRNDIRERQFEQFASDLSAFIFHSELMHEFYDKGWSTNQLVEDYNKAITAFRTKEFVYLSWARRFWSKDDYEKFEKVIAAARSIDKTVHAFNDGIISRERIDAIAKELRPLRDLAIKLLTTRARARWYNSD